MTKFSKKKTKSYKVKGHKNNFPIEDRTDHPAVISVQTFLVSLHAEWAG